MSAGNRKSKVFLNCQQAAVCVADRDPPFVRFCVRRMPPLSWNASFPVCLPLEESFSSRREALLPVLPEAPRVFLTPAVSCVLLSGGTSTRGCGFSSHSFRAFDPSGFRQSHLAISGDVLGKTILSSCDTIRLQKQITAKALPKAFVSTANPSKARHVVSRNRL